MMNVKIFSCVYIWGYNLCQKWNSQSWLLPAKEEIMGYFATQLLYNHSLKSDSEGYKFGKSILTYLTSILEFCTEVLSPGIFDVQERACLKFMKSVATLNTSQSAFTTTTNFTLQHQCLVGDGLQRRLCGSSPRLAWKR